jgi:hypothetical protein
MVENEGSNIPINGPGGNEQPRKRPVFLILLLIILVCALGYLGYTYYDLKTESEIQRTELERRTKQLEGELMIIYGQYDSLKSENDTMNQKLLAEQQNIERLLKINANNVYKIHMYEKELKTIRKVLRSYVVQIDSLNQANQELRAENLEVRRELQRVERDRQELEVKTEELSTKVELASVLAAKDILAVGLNTKSREKTKANKVAKLRVCFTLRENAILTPGPKIIYLRITRPDDVILTSGVNFVEVEGEQVVYTASREVNYENVDVELCIFWNNDGQLVPGSYTLDLFADGHSIGSSSFALK